MNIDELVEDVTSLNESFELLRQLTVQVNASDPTMRVILKRISVLKKSIGQCLTSDVDSMYVLKEQIEREQRIVESRIKNIQYAQKHLRAYPQQKIKERHVVCGKPDHSNYVSDDEIGPLPKYYR